jgi:hypothetical protein
LDEVIPSDRGAAVYYRQMRVLLERLMGDPERELERDVWRMGILRPDGGRNRIDYSPISQPWLREAAKRYNLQRLVSRTVDHLRESVHAAAALSGVLRSPTARASNRRTSPRWAARASSCTGAWAARTSAPTSRTCRRSRPTSTSSSPPTSGCPPTSTSASWRAGRATPRCPQEEIERVRYLIGRIRETIAELPGEERAELVELRSAQRTNHSAILERLPARHELGVLNVGATFDGMAG